MMPYRKTPRIIRWYKEIRWEREHLMRTRRLLLRAELTLRGVPHARGGDAVLVYHDGLWFDVIAWVRDDEPARPFQWLVDHPHAELDEGFPTHQIGWCFGFRFPIGELSDMWAQFQNAHPETVWDGPISVD